MSSAILAHCVEMKFAQERSQDEMLHQISSVTHIRRICDAENQQDLVKRSLDEQLVGDPRSIADRTAEAIKSGQVNGG